MKEIEKILGLPEKIVEKKDEITPIVIDNENNNDYNYVRNKLIGVMEKADNAAMIASMIASDKEDARSFEAFNSILNTIADTGLKLLEINRNNKKETLEPQNSPNQNINNAIIFNGTSSELKTFIKSLQEKKEPE